LFLCSVNKKWREKKTEKIVGIMLVNMVLIIILRNYFGMMYTNDERVLAIAPSLLIFSGCAAFLDGVQSILGGIMRGAGIPKKGAILNLFGYYVIGGGSYFL
jgi:MATE family multidrug resistance protein